VNDGDGDWDGNADVQRGVNQINVVSKRTCRASQTLRRSELELWLIGSLWRVGDVFSCTRIIDFCLSLSLCLHILIPHTFLNTDYCSVLIVSLSFRILVFHLLFYSVLIPDRNVRKCASPFSKVVNRNKLVHQHWNSIIISPIIQIS